ncbi:hypothetical protein [Endozoicomonas atrinae]|uniref:hypothetical protein n=1 Tax=Endozoicomonas atrinae TaxID=1333660 RepID=UPI003B0086A2
MVLGRELKLTERSPEMCSNTKFDYNSQNTSAVYKPEVQLYNHDMSNHAKMGIMVSLDEGGLEHQDMAED